MRVTLIAFTIILGTLFLPHVNAGDKPGTCPDAEFNPLNKWLVCGPILMSGDKCSNDDGCLNREICCSNGCWKSCKPPIEKIVVEKDGQCPAPPGGSNNVPKTCDQKDACKDDFHCAGNEKCCPSLCSKKCVEPAAPKPGSCPFVNTDMCTSFAPQRCNFDSNCPDTKKCCFLSKCEVGCADVVSQERDGQCPAPPGGSINVPKTCDKADVCKIDAECPKGQKCCRALCSNQCVAPAAPKPGSCPPVSTEMCTSYFPQFCDFDSNCPGTQKCCAIENCGIGCVNKVSQVPKRGLCPGAPPRPYECKNSDAELDCQSDQDCDEKLKCCPSHCDMKCIPPVSEVRKGFCPVEDFGSSDTCTKFVGGNCFFDTECEGGQKCCNFDCQKTCMKIQVPKCGKCPLLTPNLQCSFKLQKQQYRCYGDSDCAPKQKCCFYGCSKECRPAEEE